MDRPGYSHSVQQMLTFTLQTLTGVNSSLANVPVCSLARFVSEDGNTKRFSPRHGREVQIKHQYSFYF